MGGYECGRRVWVGPLYSRCTASVPTGVEAGLGWLVFCGYGCAMGMAGWNPALRLAALVESMLDEAVFKFNDF
jgi:hypothetical protein